MRNFLRFTGASAVALAATSSAGVARADTKVAVIDMTRAINETNEGGRATLLLKSLFDKRQVELDGRQTGLLKEKTALETKCKGKPGVPECDKGMAELQGKLVELQQLMVQYQQEIQKKQGEATQPIFTKMVRIIERLARSKGFDVVVDKTAAHWMKTELDLTESAVTTYNGDTPNIPPLTAQEKANLAAGVGSPGMGGAEKPKPKGPPPPAQPTILPPRK